MKNKQISSPPAGLGTAKFGCSFARRVSIFTTMFWQFWESCLVISADSLKQCHLSGFLSPIASADISKRTILTTICISLTWAIFWNLRCRADPSAFFRLVDREDGPFRIRIQGARSQEPLGRTPPQLLGQMTRPFDWLLVEQGAKLLSLKDLERNKTLYLAIFRVKNRIVWVLKYCCFSVFVDGHTVSKKPLHGFPI